MANHTFSLFSNMLSGITDLLDLNTCLNWQVSCPHLLMLLREWQEQLFLALASEEGDEGEVKSNSLLRSALDKAIILTLIFSIVKLIIDNSTLREVGNRPSRYSNVTGYI